MRWRSGEWRAGVVRLIDAQPSTVRTCRSAPRPTKPRLASLKSDVSCNGSRSAAARIRARAASVARDGTVTAAIMSDQCATTVLHQPQPDPEPNRSSSGRPPGRVIEVEEAGHSGGHLLGSSSCVVSSGTGEGVIEDRSEELEPAIEVVDSEKTTVSERLMSAKRIAVVGAVAEQLPRPEVGHGVEVGIPVDVDGLEDWAQEVVGGNLAIESSHELIDAVTVNEVRA